MSKLTVSIPTYNEIASLLEANGINIKEGQPLLLEKGTQFQTPVDFRLATMRRDCANIAAQCYEFVGNDDFVNFVEQVYQYVLTGKIEATKLETAKAKVTKPTEWI